MRQQKKWMVANIDADYIEGLNNEYTGYNNKTLKSLLAHISGSYCKTKVTNQLKGQTMWPSNEPGHVDNAAGTTAPKV
jgi:hypothetical protein